MAGRLPVDVLEPLLRGAFDPPSADDVDIERERARRRFLRSCALVSRDWRFVATALLPESIVMCGHLNRDVVRAVNAHVTAFEAGTLDVSRTTCLTIEAAWGWHPQELERVRHLALGMPRLVYLRFRSFDFRPFSYTSMAFPGSHLVIKEVANRASALLLEMTEKSTALTSLTVLGATGDIALGKSFAARATRLRIECSLGEYDHVKFRTLRVGGALDALRQLQFRVPYLYAAVYFLEQLAAAPKLTRLRCGVQAALWTEATASEALAAVVRLFVAVPKSVRSFSLALLAAPTWRSRRDVDIAAVVVDGVKTWLEEAAAVGLVELAIELGGCVIGRNGQIAGAAAELERACAAQDIRLTLDL